MKSKLNATQLEARLQVLELIVSDLAARRFPDKLSMRAWTEATGDQVTKIVDKRKAGAVTIAYQAAWDAVLAGIRAQHAFLLAKDRG